tara:strand:+ start:293 stop:430 length:138 start_codon:yes stop_codon:yes gene_type:complete
VNKKEGKLDYLGTKPRRSMSKLESWALAFLTVIGLIYIFVNFLGA